MLRLVSRFLLLLGISVWSGSGTVPCALAQDPNAYPDTLRVVSAIGEVPGRWRQGYGPDSGFGGGVFSVPLNAPVAIAFRMDSVDCGPCRRLEKGGHQLPHDNRPRNSYACGSTTADDRRALFVATDEPVYRGFDPEWLESPGTPPRYAATASSASSRPLRFHEWITTREVVPGKRLGCGAWYEGEYPPRKAYNEIREDTTDVLDYVIRERAIYLIGSSGKPEYLFRSSDGREAWKSTFELAFLPADFSELERARFSYVYPVRGGFWLRVDSSSDFEGAGVNEGIYLLEFRNGQYRLLAGASEIRMY